MNNTFTFERFLKVLKYDLKMRVPGVATAFVLLLVFVHAVHFMFDLGGPFSPSAREPLFQASWMLLSFYAPFAIYSAVGNKHGRSSFLMLPASAEEKFAGMFVVSVVVIPFVFFACAYLLDSLIVVLFRDKYVEFLTLEQLDIPLALKCIFCCVSTALLGRMLFRKKAVGKTILCVCAGTFVWSYCSAKYIESGLSSIDNVDMEALKMQYQNLFHITQYLYIIISTVLFGLTYWRIKKIQIS